MGRKAANTMFERILVAVDGSEPALRAVDIAAGLAEKFGSELLVVTVLESLRLTSEARQFADTEHLKELPAALANRLIGEPLVSQAARRATKKGVKKVNQIVENGDPAQEILRVAKALSADLIVLGSRGLGTIRGLLMGSVSHKVMNLSECPCMTVK